MRAQPAPRIIPAMQRSTSMPHFGGADGSSAAAAPAANPSTPIRRPSPSGVSPDAKRPPPLSAMTMPNGPLMDLGELNSAMYDLQRKFGGIEEWAKVMNDAITDHAGHLDKNNKRLDVIREGQAAVRTHHEQLGKDVVAVMTRFQNNDDDLKAHVASCVQLLEEEVEKLKSIHGEAQRDLVKLLDDKVREMEGDIGKFKAAVSAAAPSDSAAPLALRLGNVEGSLAALVARADAADVVAAASVAAAAAAATRDQVVEAMLRDLNARMGTACAGGPSTAPAGGQNGADPVAGGNDVWSRFTARQRNNNDQQQQPQQLPQEYDIGSPGQPRQPPQQPTTTTTIGKKVCYGFEDCPTREVSIR